MSEGWRFDNRRTAEPSAKPPADPELDAAILRVPHWRALGLLIGIAVLAGPVIWYLVTVRGGARPEIDWLDGSEWRIVEIEGRLLAREAELTFKGGRLFIAAEGCPGRSVGYRLTSGGIVLEARGAATTCGHPGADMAWDRLGKVEGLTRYGTGLALTDKDGRSLVRARR